LAAGGLKGQVEFELTWHIWLFYRL